MVLTKDQRPLAMVIVKIFRVIGCSSFFKKDRRLTGESRPCRGGSKTRGEKGLLVIKRSLPDSKLS